MLREKEIRGVLGWLAVAFLIAAGIGSAYALSTVIAEQNASVIALWMIVIAIDVLCWFGLTVVNPNEARVIQLFGAYKGTVKEQGFWWLTPLTTRRRVSLRIRNFESGKLKVNDHIGNPI